VISKGALHFNNLKIFASLEKSLLKNWMISTPDSNKIKKSAVI
jgi:hypothetical protein